MEKIIYKSNIDSPFDIENLINEKLKDRKNILYILPTVGSIVDFQNRYILKNNGIGNIKFKSFDSIKRFNIKNKVADETLKIFLIEEILSSKNYSYFPNNKGTCKLIINFLSKITVNEIKFKERLNTKYSELKEICTIYYKKLKSYGLTDISFENIVLKEDYDLIVVDQFYSLNPKEIEMLENVDKSDVIVNWPYYLENISDNKFLDTLLDKGFKIEDKSFSNNIINNSNVAIIEKNSRLKTFREMYKSIKSDLINGEQASIINTANEDWIFSFLNIDENLRLVNKSSYINANPIIKELEVLLSYLQLQDRKNILQRIALRYFKICENPDEMLYEISKMKFKNLEELIESTKITVEIEEKNLSEFVLLKNDLKVNVNKEDSFLNYNNIIEFYLNIASDVIKNLYLNTLDENLYRTGLRCISSLKLILNRLKYYDNIFSKISLKKYVEILMDHIGKMNLLEEDFYAPTIYSLDMSLGMKFQNLYLADFNINYPCFESEDYLLNKNAEDYLIDYNFEDKNYRYNYELIKFLSLLLNSEKLYLVREDSVSKSIFESYFNDLDKKEIEKESTVKELSVKAIDGLKNNDNKKVAEFYNYSNYSGFNEKLSEEYIRKSGGSTAKIEGDSLEKLKTIVSNRGYRVTDFDSYVRDPYSFLYENILEIREMLRDEKDDFYMKLGTVYHKTLELYFKEKPNALDGELLKRKLEIAIKEMSYKFSLENNTSKLLFSVLYKKLLKFIEMDIENRDGFEPYKFEESINLKLGEISIKGKIDRIDKRENKLIVTDYKTKNYKSTNQIIDLKTFQLPLYMKYIGENVAVARYGLIESAEYKNVLSNRDVVGKKRNDFTHEELWELIDNSIKGVMDIYEKIRSGDFTSEEVNETYKDLYRG